MKKREPHEPEHEHKKSRDRKHGSEESKYEPGGEERHRKPHGTGYGTERSVYEKFLTRKWEGSAPPSAQAYAQAIRKWRQLPGSIMTAPADLGTVPEKNSGDDQNEGRKRS